jgi:hypothetical protein
MHTKKDFITEEERSVLIKWVSTLDREGKLGTNPPYPTPKSIRKYSIVFPDSEVVNPIPAELENIINRILNEYKVLEFVSPKIDSFISILYPGSSVHGHTDKELKYEHHRALVCLQAPEKNGYTMYKDEYFYFEERALIKYRADIHYHGTLVVEGTIPRIILSIGWMES